MPGNNFRGILKTDHLSVGYALVPTLSRIWDHFSQYTEEKGMVRTLRSLWASPAPSRSLYVLTCKKVTRVLR